MSSRSTIIAATLLLAACGGGGSDVIPPFWLNSGVVIEDFDGDGRADIVVANAGYAPSGGTGGASISVLRQTSPGSFLPGQITVADGAQRVAIADLNGDGLPDIAGISLVYQSLSLPSRISVLLQSPGIRGQFALAGSCEGPKSGNFIAAGDMNGDGLNDIVVNDGPSVLLQRAGAPGSFEAVRLLR